MILAPAAVRIFLGREPADMRRSFTGLCGMVRDGLGADPLSGHLYCFRNKRGDKLKMLYFDRNGLAIWYKQLEQGRFHWPPMDAPSAELDSAEGKLLREEERTGLAEHGPRANREPGGEFDRLRSRPAPAKLPERRERARIGRVALEGGCAPQNPPVEGRRHVVLRPGGGKRQVNAGVTR